MEIDVVLVELILPVHEMLDFIQLLIILMMMIISCSRRLCICRYSAIYFFLCE